MLTLENIHLSYDGSAALRGVSLEVPQGRMVTIIGPNGAGKSTILRMISGLNRAASGTLRFEGEDITRLRPDQIVARGIIHIPEGRMVLAGMSVLDNLLLGAYSQPQGPGRKRDLDHVLDLFPRLHERLGQLAGSLSGGEQQMVAIARGLMGRPKLLMLDEPSLGLAPIVVESIFGVLDDIRAQGITVLLVEQNAEKALRAADFGYVLDLGTITAGGPSDELISDKRVQQAYLGL